MMSMNSLLSLLPDVERACVYYTEIPADEIIAAAKATGLHAFKVDVRKARGKNEFLDLFATILHFPAYFGRNWDALADCLSDLAWLDGAGWVLILVHCDVFAGNHEETFNRALEVLNAAAASWRERKKPFWVFMQGKAGWAPSLPKIVVD
jgi:RNAse (barnase) inhibitor barstar